MTGWAAKRFWTLAAAEQTAQGWEVRLDGRSVMTPVGAHLRVPGAALAHAIAAEWQAQAEMLDPEAMPLTRAANAAIDKVAPQRDEVVALLAGYGETDLLCYRAEGPEALFRRQAEAWDPLLAWAAEQLAAPLVTVSGVMHVPQPGESLARLRAELAALDPLRLTAVHDLVTLSGSLVIALAVLRGHATAEALWLASRIDEAWQAELWGRDEEAAQAEARKQQAFLQARRLLELCDEPG